jgi:hypothetical protein
MKALSIIFLLLLTQHCFAVQDTITAVKAKQFVGKTKTVCDRIDGNIMIKVNKKDPTILYVGPDYDNRLMALYFPNHVVRRFSFAPEKKMNNKRFCVTGKITLYENKPAIIIRNEAQVNEEEINSYIYREGKQN